MQASVDQIAERIYRISTYVPEIGPTGFTFNQFLVDAEEPLLYHTGMRGLFPIVSEAIARVLPVEKLRWIAFAHVEADECGAMNEFLAAAPHAQVAHGALGCMLTLNDQAARAPRPLPDGEVIDLGSAGLARRVVEIPTPHVPHNWESHVFFEQHTQTLFCGDLLTQLGNGPAIVGDDLIDAAIAAEDLFHQTSLGPLVPATYRKLADLHPTRLAIMHGSSYEGDATGLLCAMADVYEQRYGCASGLRTAQPLPEHSAPPGPQG
ncbi:MAG TPA: MBL fold metallo-hydrolase [Jatrophihabitantaceae bacterium]|jgi:flavorubredoxin